MTLFPYTTLFRSTVIQNLRLISDKRSIVQSMIHIDVYWRETQYGIHQYYRRTITSMLQFLHRCQYFQSLHWYTSSRYIQINCSVRNKVMQLMISSRTVTASRSTSAILCRATLLHLQLPQRRQFQSHIFSFFFRRPLCCFEYLVAVHYLLL
jgi:hypothetical protein